MQVFFTQIKIVIQNPIFLAAITSWLLSQFIKTFFGFCGSSVHSLPVFFDLLVWRTGGMPSSHSSLVTSLCTTIGFRNGINSDIFCFALVFFLVVIRDAFGVRRSSGMQAHKLNEIGNELSTKSILDIFKPLKEVDGHTPMEVLCGCFLGFFIGLAFSLLK